MFVRYGKFLKYVILYLNFGRTAPYCLPSLLVEFQNLKSFCEIASPANSRVSQVISHGLKSLGREFEPLFLKCNKLRLISILFFHPQIMSIGQALIILAANIVAARSFNLVWFEPRFYVPAFHTSIIFICIYFCVARLS